MTELASGSLCSLMRVQSARLSYHEKIPTQGEYLFMVRAARIELASLAWKAGILAIIRRPQTHVIITDFAILESEEILT